MNPDNLTIRCNHCATTLELDRTTTDPLTGEVTLYVEPCGRCIADAYDDGLDANNEDDE